MTPIPDLPYLGLFALIALPAAIIDLRTLRIPDLLNFPAMALLLAYSALFRLELLQDSLVAAAVALAFLWIIRLVTKGLGFGDVKFGVCIGLYTGLRALFPALMVAASTAILVSLILLRTGKIRRDSLIPFAPFLALGALTGPILAALFLS